jgi:hypothetical protein
MKDQDMTTVTRKMAFSMVTVCITLVVGAVPAVAKTHHHKKHVHHTMVPESATDIRAAQEHLANLDYYTGTIDGKMGAETVAAIKNFQRDHGLKADGVLGPKTKQALVEADTHAMNKNKNQPPITHENISRSELNQVLAQDYALSLQGGSAAVKSRFAKIDVNEVGNGTDKGYRVLLNGQEILTANGQASVIGASPTYDLGSEDAIVFTTYAAGDRLCSYKNHILVLSKDSNRMVDIDNCTRDYEAQVVNGSLYINFPEHGENRAVGSIWRLDGMNVERL